MKKIIYALLMSLIILSGCSTGYHPAGLNGGFADMALSADTYKVSFRGNGLSSQDHVQSYLLRRCAELTINKGYRYFVVINGNDLVNTDVIQHPTTVDIRSSSNHRSYGDSYSLTGNIDSNTHAIINPGSQTRITRYKSQAIIKMLNRKIPEALDAKIILSNFSEK